MEKDMHGELKAVIEDYLPLRDVVFNTLRQAILKGELKPGERLMEIQLAGRLGVSRTPVREAIRKLELEGLVVMVPRKGAEVSSITEKSLRDVLEVRKALEELAAELACQRMTEEEIAEAEQQLEEFKLELQSNDVTKIAEMDVHFHEMIYMGTKNERLIQLLSNLREQMYRYRMEYIRDEDKRGTLAEEHAEIIERIKNHDIEAAKEASRKHIDNQESAVSKRIKS